MSSEERNTDRAPEQAEQQARGKSDEAAPAEAARERPRAHESDLFPPTPGPRYFGTGSYGGGGSNTEGNAGIGDLNPLGGFGTFTDAGGPGSPALYGEELPLLGGTPAGVVTEAAETPAEEPAASKSPAAQKRSAKNPAA